MRCTGLSLTEWEVMTIKSLSEAYVSELNQATAKDRPPPYVAAEESLQIDRDMVEKKLRKAFSAFRRNPNSKPRGEKGK